MYILHIFQVFFSFSEFEEQRGHRNDAMLMKEGRFGRQCKASLKALEMKDTLLEYLDHDTKCQNEVARLLRSLLPSPVVHYEWTLEVLVGYHLMEPFLGILLDPPRPNHLELSKPVQTDDGTYSWFDVQFHHDSCSPCTQ